MTKRTERIDYRLCRLLEGKITTFADDRNGDTNERKNYSFVCSIFNFVSAGAPWWTNTVGMPGIDNKRDTFGALAWMKIYGSAAVVDIYRNRLTFEEKHERWTWFCFFFISVVLTQFLLLVRNRTEMKRQKWFSFVNKWHGRNWTQNNERMQEISYSGRCKDMPRAGTKMDFVKALSLSSFVHFFRFSDALKDTSWIAHFFFSFFSLTLIYLYALFMALSQ